MCYRTGRGNVAQKSLRFHAAVKMVSDYQLVTKCPVAASRQLAPEVIMVMFMSTLDTPRRGGMGKGKNGVRNHFGRHFTNIVYIIKKMF